MLSQARTHRLMAGLQHAAGAVANEVPTTGYRLPPQEIIDLVDVPPEPNLSFSPDRKLVLQLYRPPPLPPISELARPELKLAGESLVHVKLLVPLFGLHACASCPV